MEIRFSRTPREIESLLAVGLSLLIALLTTATVPSLVLLFILHAVRDGTVKIRWLLTFLAGVMAIPVFGSPTDTTAAVAAVFCLLFVSTTAFTTSVIVFEAGR